MGFRNKGLGNTRGWGGARIGSGSKPKQKAPKPGLVVFQGGKVDLALAEPPESLPEAQKAIWRAWAPLAIEARTLSADTVPAFGMLCELQVQRLGLLATFEQDGVEVTPGGLRVYLQCVKQVEGLLGRFCLAPFGKPLVSEKPQVAVNPFTQVAG